MTAAELRKILDRPRNLERAYHLAKEKADRFRLSLTGGKTAKYTYSGRTHVRDSNSVERAYCQLADYDAEADKLLSELVTARKKAETYIESVQKSSEREVLTRRYIMGQSWEDIAENMGYERRYIFKLHNKALDSLIKDT